MYTCEFTEIEDFGLQQFSASSVDLQNFALLAFPLSPVHCTDASGVGSCP